MWFRLIFHNRSELFNPFHRLLILLIFFLTQQVLSNILTNISRSINHELFEDLSLTRSLFVYSLYWRPTHYWCQSAVWRSLRYTKASTAESAVGNSCMPRFFLKEQRVFGCLLSFIVWKNREIGDRSHCCIGDVGYNDDIMMTILMTAVLLPLPPMLLMMTMDIKVAVAVIVWHHHRHHHHHGCSSNDAGDDDKHTWWRQLWPWLVLFISLCITILQYVKTFV